MSTEKDTLLQVSNEREADLFVERVSPKIRKDIDFDENNNNNNIDDDGENDGIENLTASGRYNIDPDVPTFTEIIMEPYEYLAQTPGKGVRERLVGAFNRWLKIEKEPLSKVQEVIMLLHNASLMIDDIEDNSKMRRGVPVVHSIFGVPATINTANYVYFVALKKCQELGKPSAVTLFVDELIRLHRGQGLDINWRDRCECPSESEYISMVLDKTGGLFRLAVGLAQCMSDCKLDFLPLVNSIGVYFQILDDYVNLQSDRYMKNKSFCEDLTEGKFSFPIIHAIHANPHDHRILNILKQRTEDHDIKKHAVDYMRTLGTFDYTVRVVNKLFRQVLDEIEKLGGNPELVKILHYLHQLSGISGKQNDDQAASSSSSST